MADHSITQHAAATLQERDTPSLQKVVAKLRENGVVSTRSLDAARQKAKGARSSAKRYLNQK